MAFRVGQPRKLGTVGLFDPDNYMDALGNHYRTDPNAPRRYYNGPGGGMGQGLGNMNFLRPRNQKITNVHTPITVTQPKPIVPDPQDLEDNRRPGDYFGSDENQQRQFNLDTYSKAPPGVLFGETDSRFETPEMRVTRREAGDTRGPGMGPGAGSSIFGELENNSNMSEIDPRLVQAFGDNAAKLPGIPRSLTSKPTGFLQT